MPWADVAVPSLASGLLITRIGCYLFGCDFGKRLGDGSPAFLQKLGTFPHWPKDTLEGSEGAPAFARHLDIAGKHTPAYDELMKMGHSWPVHPTQIYESLVGLGLLVLLLWQRKSQRFRGQIFFLFAFGYGYLRFLIEALRDDTERGEFGPQMGEHWLISGSLLVMSIAFVFGISLGITNPKVRNLARVLAFVPPVVAFIALRPASFGKQLSVQLSTSQWVGLFSAVICSYFYAKFWEEARKSPKLAMGLESLGDIKATADDMAPRRRKSDDEDEDGEEHDEPEPVAEETEDGETAPEAPVAKKPKKKKGLKKKAKKVSEPAEDEPSEDADEPSDEKPSDKKDDDKTEVDSDVKEKDDA
jgi:phosphatidylglycerol:prolipoprotein diacylglycerol transferase